VGLIIVILQSRRVDPKPKQLQPRQQPAAPPPHFPQSEPEEKDWPPDEDFSNETPIEREERLEREREAKCVNDEINAQIEVEKFERSIDRTLGSSFSVRFSASYLSIEF